MGNTVSPFRRRVDQGLFLALLLFTALLMLAALHFRLTRLPEFAEVLPPETQELWAWREPLNLTVEGQNTLLAEPISQLNWLGSMGARAKVDGHTVQIWRTHRRAAARRFFASKATGPYFQSYGVSCLPSHPLCFTFAGPYLLVAA